MSTLAGMLVLPASAAAHLQSGTVAVDDVISLSPRPGPAFAARVYQSDRGIAVTVHPGHEVELLGYLHEPVFRLGSQGLAVNDASPTAASVGLVPRSRLSSASHPVWQLKPEDHSVAWHDTRASRLPPGAQSLAWSIPLLVDGQPAVLTGHLRRLAKPSAVICIALLLGLIGISALTLAGKDREESTLRRQATVSSLAAAVCALLVNVVFILDSYASAGTWIAGLDELAFLGVGVWVLTRGPRPLRMFGAIGTGLVALAVGLSKGAVFLHPVVLAVANGDAVRILVCAAIGLGTGAAMLGGACYLRYPEAMRSLSARLARPAARYRA